MLALLILFIRVYELAMIVHIILSWVVPVEERRNNKFFNYVDLITEPVLKPIRKKLVELFPPIMRFRIDFSPIIVFLALSVLEGLIKIIFI